MKRLFMVLLFFISLISSATAWADPPVQIGHNLTGCIKSTDSLTLTYVLNVRNTSDQPLSNLVLSLDPLAIMSEDQVHLDVLTLAPHIELQIPFTVTSYLLDDQELIRHLPLFWDCAGATDAGPVQFPVVSNEGGAL